MGLTPPRSLDYFNLIFFHRILCDGSRSWIQILLTIFAKQLYFGITDSQYNAFIQSFDTCTCETNVRHPTVPSVEKWAHSRVPFKSLLLALHPQAVSLLLSGIIASWHFLEFHTHEIIHYDWWGGADLASFTQQISIGHSFSLLNSILLYEYITISVSVDGHLVCIHFGAFINNTSECSATNVCVNMCFISLE